MAGRGQPLDERDRCVQPTRRVVSATWSGESDSETAVQDGERRRRRNQCTRRIGRRARRDNWLRGQRGEVQGVQKGRRNGQRGRLIALLPVVAMLGAEIDELGVHRPRHVFAVRCLLVGRCDDRIGGVATGSSGGVHLHLHARGRRQPRAGVRRNRQLREQHDADERAANVSQKLACHDHNPCTTPKPTADAAPTRTARVRSSTIVRLRFTLIEKVPTGARARISHAMSLVGPVRITLHATAQIPWRKGRARGWRRPTINGSDRRHRPTAAVSTADSLH